MPPQQRVVIAQVYPWDLDDALLARTADAGVAELAIAAHYHAVRAVHRSPQGIRVVQTPVSAAYFEPDPAVWSGAALVPEVLRVPGGEVVGAAERARAVGLEPRVWLTLTHHDRPEPGPFSVVDAFGSRSAHAVCPAWPEVRDFARRLVVDTVRRLATPRIMIEALAGLGFVHLVAHDKASLAWLDARLARLLSYCFCAACRSESVADGRDPDADVDRIRAAALDPRADAGEVEAALQVRRIRQAERIAAEAVGPVDGTPLDALVSATTDRAAFGSFAPLEHAPRGVTGLTAEVGGARGWRDLDDWATEPLDVAIAATVTVLPQHPSIAGTVERIRRGGRLDAVTLYHWGSAPAEAAELLAPLLSAMRDPASR